jgi:alpha-galactosidase
MKLLVERARPYVRGGPDGQTDLAPSVQLEVLTGGPEGWTMRVYNTSGTPIPVRACGLVVPLESQGAIRMFQHGYQSWSPSGLVTLGVDRDPSLAEDSFELFCAAHHADQRRARDDELRSEAVTILADGTEQTVLVGWLGGDRHDGTLRLRGGPDGPEMVVEAFLGDAVLAPGSERDLHPVRLIDGQRDRHPEMLDRWAAEAGRQSGARVSAPYQIGWCSWYHYFSEVTESDLDANLALSDRWPFEVFQLDDGYQSHIGDWLTTRSTFPSPLPRIAQRIAEVGRRPGIWLAPFLVHPDSEVAKAHPEWIATMPADAAQPLPGMINDIWGGVVYVLDTTRPEVLAHLESVATELVAMGFTYLKLDFTYAPSFDGRYADPSKTPAERVRAGYDAIRRGAGDEAFLLGCGAPLAACAGVVDGMRIGPDVAPSWGVPEGDWHPSRYRETAPATANAWQATLARSFLHRRWWLNDPDCLMLRTTHTDLPPESVRAWALAVAASGGMALVSDDLSLLDDAARDLLDEVISIGRDVDAAALAGSPPACPDLMDRCPPTRLTGGGVELVGDPIAGTAELMRG